MLLPILCVISALLGSARAPPPSPFGMSPQSLLSVGKLLAPGLAVGHGNGNPTDCNQANQEQLNLKKQELQRRLRDLDTIIRPHEDLLNKLNRQLQAKNMKRFTSQNDLLPVIKRDILTLQSQGVLPHDLHLPDLTNARASIGNTGIGPSTGRGFGSPQTTSSGSGAANTFYTSGGTMPGHSSDGAVSRGPPSGPPGGPPNPPYQGYNEPARPLFPSTHPLTLSSDEYRSTYYNDDVGRYSQGNSQVPRNPIYQTPSIITEYEQWIPQTELRHAQEQGEGQGYQYGGR